METAEKWLNNCRINPVQLTFETTETALIGNFTGSFIGSLTRNAATDVERLRCG